MNRNQLNRRDRISRARAFSLVELMVVLVIIGLLAGMVTMNVRGYLIKGKRNTARLEISRMAEAMETYYSLHDRYPTTQEGLEALVQPTEKMPEALLDRIPTDPWGRPYQFNAPGRETAYEILSLGADGREGGEGNDADVESWNLDQD